MTSGSGGSIVDTIDSLIDGFVTPGQAIAIANKYPSVSGSIAEWIRQSARQGDWRRVERLANLAAPLDAPGLGEVLRGLVDAQISELNVEDVVEILGEINSVDSAGSIFKLIGRSLKADAPSYWLSQKAILALSEFGTAEAEGYLRTLTAATWPNPIRWHAAVALCIEEDLGFDEDQMLG